MICVVNGKDVKPIHIIYAKWWHSEPLINFNLPVKESYIYMWYSPVLHEIKYYRKIEMFIQNIWADFSNTQIRRNVDAIDQSDVV